MENKLISASIMSREAFDTVVSCMDIKKFSDKGKLIAEEIQAFYTSDENATRCDKDIITTRLARKFPKHAELFTTIISNLQDVSVPNIREEVMELKKQNIKEALATACTVGGNDETLQKLFDEFNSCAIQGMDGHDAPEAHIARSVQEVVAKTSGKNRIRLLPQAISDTTGGGALRGHHILIFARPDMGKTSLGLTLTRGFCQQGLRTLYFSNEDPINDIIKRSVGCLIGASTEQIEQSPDRAEQAALRKGYDKIIFIEAFPGTLHQLEEAVKLHRPDVLIVDQARNLEHKQESKVLRLEIIEQFIRNLGKKYDCLTISFTQAGDSAEGKMVLTMGDVDFSNTGMQASADLMIGMGANQEYEAQGKRILSFPKNKLSSDKEPKQVNFNGALSRIT